MRFKLDTCTLLLLFAGCALPWLGSYDFFTRGEAREALAVQDIYSNGAWVLPRGYDGAVASKPPMFHWLAAGLSIAVGGPSELTIRMPSALLSLLTAIVFMWLNSSRLRDDGRLLFFMFLMFSLEWLRATLTARVDMAHSATLACGIMAGFEAIGRHSRWLWALSSLLIGLSAMAKGPVALILSTGTLGGWVLMARRERATLVSLSLSLLAAASIASIWYALAFTESPDEFGNRFWYENIERFTGGEGDMPHDHSVLYLTCMHLLGSLPWTPVWVVVAYRRAPRTLERLVAAVRSSEPALLFSLFVAVSIFAFYSIPSSKRAVYLLASYPFAALALALILQDSIVRFEGRIRAAAIAGCLAILLGQSVVMPELVANRTSQRRLAAVIEEKLGRGQTVFSYDEEFYGASYYAGIRFYRIPEPDEEKEPVLDPESGDLLVFVEEARATAVELLAERGLGTTELARMRLGDEEVVINRLEPHEGDEDQRG